MHYEKISTIIISIVALIFSFISLVYNMLNRSKISAEKIWYDYEKISFDNPEMSMAKYFHINYKDRKIDDCRKKFYKYQWYISIMLYSCETLMNSQIYQKKFIIFGKVSNDWVDSIEHQVWVHIEFLQSDHFKSYRKQLPKNINIIIDKVIDDCQKEKVKFLIKKCKENCREAAD